MVDENLIITHFCRFSLTSLTCGPSGDALRDFLSFMKTWGSSVWCASILGFFIHSSHKSKSLHCLIKPTIVIVGRINRCHNWHDTTVGLTKQEIRKINWAQVMIDKGLCRMMLLKFVFALANYLYYDESGKINISKLLLFIAYSGLSWGTYPHLKHAPFTSCRQLSQVTPIWISGPLVGPPVCSCAPPPSRRLIRDANCAKCWWSLRRPESLTSSDSSSSLSLLSASAPAAVFSFHCGAASATQ